MNKAKNIKPTVSGKVKKDFKSQKNKIIFYLFSVIILTIIVYSNSLNNFFITNYDDNIYLAEIEKVSDLTFSNIMTIFSSYMAGNYHPLTILSLTIDFKLFGLNHFPFHVVNLLFHCANVLLVFWLIYLLIKRFEAAVIVSLFFAIHPMHVESVTWIVERKDLLYTFFYLLSLISYILYIKDDKNHKFIILALILFLLSLFSKPAAMSLAPLIILIDYYFSRGFSLKIMLEKIPFFLLSVVFGILTILSQKSLHALNNFSPDISIIDRVFMVCYSTMFYIVKFFLPFNLSAIYYYPELAGGKLPMIYYFAPLGIALIVFLIIKLKKIRQELLFGFLFYFLTIALVLQFLPVGFAIAADRYSYVPYIGLLFIAAKLYCGFVDNDYHNFTIIRRNYIIIIILTSAFVCSLISYERNKIWKDGIILFNNIVEQYPETGHAYFGRANGKYDRGNFKDALIDYNEAIKRNFKHPIIYSNLGGCYFMMDSLKKAMDKFDKVLKMDSTFAMSYYGRAMVKQKINDFVGAIEDYKKSVKYNYNLPQSYNAIGYILLNRNDLQGALSYINLALKYNPKFSIAYNNKGTAEYYMKKYNEALNDFNLSVFYDSTYGLAYFNRALVSVELNNLQGGCNDFNKAANLGYPPARDALDQYCR
jgi:protein O-mannosyl-transferase